MESESRSYACFNWSVKKKRSETHLLVGDVSVDSSVVYSEDPLGFLGPR